MTDELATMKFIKREDKAEIKQNFSEFILTSDYQTFFKDLKCKILFFILDSGKVPNSDTELHSSSESESTS